VEVKVDDDDDDDNNNEEEMAPGSDVLDSTLNPATLASELVQTVNVSTLI